ncbi:CaiB/BaiF CoA transferase family protein [Aquabacter spiritensis]|uniref:Crotonobetainyl-CoA:carnitine CoA-transferase CaiB-like acyl-CoA transferase n=1 Tax=Aquabacter spiritensis TaxID=933073 RepID=A0A4R3LWH8_9HYPH|nr:CoA transferase [Aquabacter spiritensis]TCT04981.1 crotonobetainyl-CoA:carnitine CoA-transferase CaiB-like acyl-CoA transferase [Aquabacter spiritensis]
MAGPLASLKVLDLSTVIAGPYAGHILGDFGAAVIKIEPPEGDIMGAAGPARTPGRGAAFLNCNRDKEIRRLDLKDPGRRAEFLALVADADVLLHNMRMAAAERLGLGPEAMRAVNPRLVYCAIVGYGQDGPYRDRPAYDDVIQAEAGWAELHAQTGDAPRYAPTIAADKITALYAVAAITSALTARAATGLGATVEVPMFEVLTAFLAVEHLAGLTFVPPLGGSGYARVLSPHRRPYRTADGHISVLPYSARHWRSFFEAVGRDDWARDPALAADAERAAMIGILYARLDACLPERTTADWLALLRALDIPCAPVNSLDALLEDAHLKAVGLFQKEDHATEGPLLRVRSPIRFG